MVPFSIIILVYFSITIYNTWKQAIYGRIFADFMCFFVIGLFSHAEVFKDISEYFVGDNAALTCDVWEIV